jgi:hypothetical protein
MIVAGPMQIRSLKVCPKGVFGYGLGWMLVPRSIPQMELTPQRLQKVRKTDVFQLPENFPAQKSPFVIPANSSASILLDQGYLTNAYPCTPIQQRKKCFHYFKLCRGLYIIEPDKKDWRTLHQKGNRNEVEGKRFIGVTDSLVSDGSDGQEFTSLLVAYIQIFTITGDTRSEPLEIDDLYGIFTGYPFTQNAKFNADNDTLNKILETGWRTARSVCDGNLHGLSILRAIAIRR